MRLKVKALVKVTCRLLTWNLRMSRGFPAFFRQFWLHFMKNFRKNLKHKTNFTISVDYNIECQLERHVFLTSSRV